MLTVEEAIAVLDAIPIAGLQLLEDGVVIGYIGHHSLLQAAMDNGKGGGS